MINRFLSGLESRWSLLLLVVGAVSSIALPAWAVRAANLLEAYAPASWVAAGFAGFLLFALCYALIGFGRGRWIRAKYDKRMLAHGYYVDPMAKTYEGLRIFLNDFCLPSHPLIDGKTFIDCQIIGPANIILQYGNSVQEAQYPISDAVYIQPDNPNIYNSMFVRDCLFRRCSFQRVTFLVPSGEYESAKDWAAINWITLRPNAQGQLPLAKSDESQPSQSPVGTAVEKQP
jgi:hypothetical protein